MVGSGQPKGVIALHSSPADKDILESVVKRMTHMKLTRDVRGRNYDSIRLFVIFAFGMEVFSLEPKIVNTVFDILGVILLCKFFCHKKSPFLSCETIKKSPHGF